MKKITLLTDGKGLGIKIDLDFPKEIVINKNREIICNVIKRAINFSNKTNIFVIEQGALCITTKEDGKTRFVPIEIWESKEELSKHDESIGIQLRPVNMLDENDQRIAKEFETAKNLC